MMENEMKKAFWSVADTPECDLHVTNCPVSTGLSVNAIPNSPVCPLPRLNMFTGARGTDCWIYPGFVFAQ